jgi:hypothetical protein
MRATIAKMIRERVDFKHPRLLTCFSEVSDILVYVVTELRVEGSGFKSTLDIWIWTELKINNELQLATPKTLRPKYGAGLDQRCIKGLG